MAVLRGEGTVGREKKTKAMVDEHLVIKPSKSWRASIHCLSTQKISNFCVSLLRGELGLSMSQLGGMKEMLMEMPFNVLDVFGDIMFKI